MTGDKQYTLSPDRRPDNSHLGICISKSTQVRDALIVTLGAVLSSVTRQLSHICMVTDVHGACTHRRKVNSTVSHKSSLSLWGRFCQLSPVTCHLSLTDIHCRVTIVIYILLFFIFMCMRWVKSSQVRALLSLWRGTDPSKRAQANSRCPACRKSNE